MMRLFFRNVALSRPSPWRGRWPTAPNMELYDVRICQHCGHLVSGRLGQRIAIQYHENLQEQIDGPQEVEDPGGYVIGGGPLPPEMTGARPPEEEE